VAFRAEPRFTEDVDLAVAVADDQQAEGIVNRVQVPGSGAACGAGFRWSGGTGCAPGPGTPLRD
jgi:hypothetical protein